MLGDFFGIFDSTLVNKRASGDTNASIHMIIWFLIALDFLLACFH